MTQNAINNRASQMSIGDILISGDTIATQTTNQNLIIAPNGTGVTNITNGITFDGTNVLKHFVDATAFTPILEFGGASTGITYDTQIGIYSRIGSIVFVFVGLFLTSKGSATGQAVIKGLPLVATGTSFNALATRANLVAINSAGGYSYIVGSVLQSTSQIDLQQYGNNVSGLDLTNADFANNSVMVVSGYYVTS